MLDDMAEHQQFNLRWNNHTNNIIQVFLEHLSSEELVDVTLSCQGQFLKAHRMILSACSPYFQELFKHHTTKHPVVILNGIKYADLQMMIKFMYHGEIRVKEAQLDDLLAAAETLQVKGLSNVRTKYEKGEIHSQNINKDINKTMAKDCHNDTTPQVLKDSPKPHMEKNKPLPSDPPRIRKKRKMSHTVNELAKETVFTSNGAVCLEPESTSGATDPEPPMIKVETLDIKDNHNDDETAPPSSSEVKRLRVKGKGKSTGQRAVSVTEKVRVPRKIPRPPNAFMIFANEWRRKMAFQYPNESNKKISVRLGVMWKGLNINAKEAYYASAKKADEEHKLKYPGYYYSPKEARLRKNLKQDLMLARCLPTNIQDVDALRLVKVFINADRQGNMVIVPSKEHEVDGAEKEDLGEDLTLGTLNGKKDEADEKELNISHTSVSI